MMRRIYLILLFIFFLHDLFAQCAMCKAVAEDQSDIGAMDGGSINAGILYIMAIPYILLFIFFRKKIFGFLKELRKAKG